LRYEHSPGKVTSDTFVTGGGVGFRGRRRSGPVIRIDSSGRAAPKLDRPQLSRVVIPAKLPVAASNGMEYYSCRISATISNPHTSVLTIE